MNLPRAILNLFLECVKHWQHCKYKRKTVSLTKIATVSRVNKQKKILAENAFAWRYSKFISGVCKTLQIQAKTLSLTKFGALPLVYTQKKILAENEFARRHSKFKSRVRKTLITLQIKNCNVDNNWSSAAGLQAKENSFLRIPFARGHSKFISRARKAVQIQRKDGNDNDGTGFQRKKLFSMHMPMTTWVYIIINLSVYVLQSVQFAVLQPLYSNAKRWKGFTWIKFQIGNVEKKFSLCFSSMLPTV